MYFRLNLNNSTSDLLQGQAFIDAFQKNIPQGTTSLDLNGYAFEGKSTNDLIEAFKSIPASVTSMDLSGTALFTRNPDELTRLFQALPRHVKNLTLRGNTFNHPPHITAKIFQPLSHLTSLDLRKTGLEARTEQQLAIDFQSLQKTKVRFSMRPISKIYDNTANFDFKMAKFLAEVNQDIDELNKLIKSYNVFNDRPRQIERLQIMYRRKQELEDKYSDMMITTCHNYVREIHHNLFLEMQRQFQTLGIPSLFNVTKRNPQDDVFNSGPSDSLEELIANMPPVKAEAMLAILTREKFNPADLNTLFLPMEPGYLNYQSFLKNNTVTYLGGNNSKNFKVSPKNGATAYVLKVENRFGSPRIAEVTLKENSLRHVLIPVWSERQVRSQVYNKHSNAYETATRTLLITEYCQTGSIEDALGKPQSPDMRLKSALSVSSQMGIILKKFHKEGCAFPDMKNSNWLLDENGMVRLSDTKSFLITEPNGTIDQKISYDKRWYYLTSTPFMSPTEFKNNSFSADKAHSYMLGKNLYQYLTGCNYAYLYNKHDAAYYNFSYPIFMTPQGKELAKLIKSMILPDPALRISIDVALASLHHIQKMDFSTDCQRILNEIQSDAYHGDKTKQFCKGIRQEIAVTNASDINAFLSIKRRLEEHQVSNQKHVMLWKGKCQFILNAIRNTPYKFHITESYLNEMERKMGLATATEFEEIHRELDQKNIENLKVRDKNVNECTELLHEIRTLGKNIPDLSHYCETIERNLNQKTETELRNVKNELYAKRGDLHRNQQQMILSNACRDLINTIRVECLNDPYWLNYCKQMEQTLNASQVDLAQIKNELEQKGKELSALKLERKSCVAMVELFKHECKGDTAWEAELNGVESTLHALTMAELAQFKQEYQQKYIEYTNLKQDRNACQSLLNTLWTECTGDWAWEKVCKDIAQKLNDPTVRLAAVKLEIQERNEEFIKFKNWKTKTLTLTCQNLINELCSISKTGAPAFRSHWENELQNAQKFGELVKISDFLIRNKKKHQDDFTERFQNTLAELRDTENPLLITFCNEMEVKWQENAKMTLLQLIEHCNALEQHLSEAEKTARKQCEELIEKIQSHFKNDPELRSYCDEKNGQLKKSDLTLAVLNAIKDDLNGTFKNCLKAYADECEQLIAELQNDYGIDCSAQEKQFKKTVKMTDDVQKMQGFTTLRMELMKTMVAQICLLSQRLLRTLRNDYAPDSVECKQLNSLEGELPNKTLHEIIQTRNELLEKSELFIANRLDFFKECQALADLLGAFKGMQQYSKDLLNQLMTPSKPLYEFTAVRDTLHKTLYKELIKDICLVFTPELATEFQQWVRKNNPQLSALQDLKKDHADRIYNECKDLLLTIKQQDTGFSSLNQKQKQLCQQRESELGKNGLPLACLLYIEASLTQVQTDVIAQAQAQAMAGEQAMLQAEQECRKLLDSIPQNTFTQKFCADVLTKLGSFQTLESLEKIKGNLLNVKNDKATPVIQEVIKKLREEYDWFGGTLNISKRVKADKIEQALMLVPAEQRATILTDKTPEALAVRIELARHRHCGINRDETHVTNAGQVDKARAADSFTFFRSKLKLAPVDAPDHQAKPGK